MTDPSPIDAVPQLLPRLRRIVAQIAGPREVDDIVQECCVRILEHESRFEGNATAFASWASTITRNLSRTFLKQQSRVREQSVDAGKLDSAKPAAKADETIDERRVGWVLDQLARLPQADRQLLAMRYYDGMTVEAVGEKLGISQAGASKRLQKALKRLQQRARRQGLFSGLLPLPWAAKLASATGSSTVNLGILGAGSLASALFIGSFFTPDPATPVQGSTAGMKHTSFVPALAAPIDPAKNQLWCGALQLAWRALVREAGEGFAPQRLDALAALVHGDGFRGEHVDPRSYVALAGFDSDELIEAAQKRLIEQFGRGRDPVLDSYRGTRLPLSYAFLAKAMRFGVAFEDHKDRSFRFGRTAAGAGAGAGAGTGTGAGTDIEAWGIGRFDPARELHHEWAKQIRVLHYASPQDFTLELRPVGKDRILLARRPKSAAAFTLESLWKDVHGRVRAWPSLDEEARERLAMDGGERMQIPKLDFDLRHVFADMASGLEEAPMVRMVQTLRVRLDHEGAELKSRAMTLRGSAFPKPKVLVFDQAFFLAFAEEGKDRPYAAMWVADPELLVARVAQEKKAKPAKK